VAGSQRGRNVVFGIAVLALLALVPLAYRVFLSDVTPPKVTAPPPAPPAPKPAPRPVTLTLSQMDGRVEIRHGQEGWTPASVGDALKASDAVRTPVGGSAILTGGDAYEVRMDGATDVEVGELTDSISRLMLGAGMATATVHGGKHTFEVRAAHTDAVARTREGTFAISSNGQGTVAVGTEAGQVELSGHGRVVIVRAGEESVVHAGSAPTAPSKIPSSLLLKVQWPAQRELATRAVLIRGTAEPGAQVEVAGHPVTVGDDGHFSHRVRLAEGKNALTVRARAVGKRDQRERRDLRVDTTAPKAVIHPKWK
jgi:hypothetical protein